MQTLPCRCLIFFGAGLFTWGGRFIYLGKGIPVLTDVRGQRKALGFVSRILSIFFSPETVSQPAAQEAVLSPSSQIQSAYHHTQLDSRKQNQIPKLSREAFHHLRNRPSTWVPFLQMLFSMIFQSEIISKILSPLEYLFVHHRRAQSYYTQIKTHLTSGSLNAGPLDYATNTFIHRAIFPGLSGDF